MTEGIMRPEFRRAMDDVSVIPGFKEFRGPCPMCNCFLVVHPGSSLGWTTCGYCTTRFKAHPCPHKNPECPAHLEFYPSEAVEVEYLVYHATLRDQEERPEAWLPCWAPACHKGTLYGRMGRLVFAIGECPDCDGFGLVPKP